MTLCAECKLLSYMTAEFNLQHRLYTEILSSVEHHSACLNNGCALLAGRDMKAMIILFVCHSQMNLRIHIEQKMSLVVLMLSSIAAVKGITIAAAKEHYLLNPGIFLWASSSALSMPRWCVGLLNRSRFNHKQE